MSFKTGARVAALAAAIITSFAFTGCGQGLSISGQPTPDEIRDAITRAFAEYQAIVAQVQNRMLRIQNTDGGWDWLDTPTNMESSTSAPSAAPNMFGVNALGVLDANSVTANPAAIAALQTTADYLMARPLSRTQRLYAPDCEFLIGFSAVTGNAAYRARGEQSQVYEKEYYAASHILGTTTPSDAQVNAVTSAQIATVTDAQIAAAFRARVLSSRNASIRAYDNGMRMRVAALRGDRGYHRAMAEIVAADFTEISSAATPQLLGLAATISDLIDYKSEVVFSAVIEQARSLLLARQNPSTGLFDGNPQDHAFIARALYDLRDVAPLAVLLSVLRTQVSADGYILDSAGKENSEAQSELLSALAVIVKL